MTIENTSAATLGWFHPGFYPDTSPRVIRSTEHGRKLQHVSQIARSFMEVALEAACDAQDIGNPLISPAGTVDTHGWQPVRVYYGTPAEAPSWARLDIVRRAVGKIGLTQEDYIEVQEHRSEGGKGTQSLLAAAAESGFSNPARLLHALPVLNFADMNAAPREREVPLFYASDLDEVYGLLPDGTESFQQAVTAIAAALATRADDWARLERSDASEEL